MACDTPYLVDNPTPADGRGLKLPVPCGRCPLCKRRRVNEWVFRLEQEEKRSDSAWFLTLTYDQQTVPLTSNNMMTLRKKDLQNYWKRLRKLNPQSKIKYYAVGEYGSTTRRPHYHAIVFNCSEQSLVDAWSLDGISIGHVHIGKVTGASIAYTIKYIDKDSVIPLHANDFRQKEFSAMSKRLGDNYINQKTEAYHKADYSRNYLTRPGGIRVPMPRYYRNKMFDDKEKRKQVAHIQQAVKKSREELKAHYEKVYGSNNVEFTFDDYLESCRYGRYKAHVSRSKDSRNKI